MAGSALLGTLADFGGNSRRWDLFRNNDLGSGEPKKMFQEIPLARE
jgi:hypothetical protein